MARIRTLKPEWLHDEKLAALSDTTRVLSVGLILLADDQGRGRANPAFIAGHVWSYHAPTLAKVQAELERLAAIQFVTLYTVAGQRYYQIRNWSKHQYVQHPAAPRLPGPADCSDASASPPDAPGDSAAAPGDWPSAEALVKLYNEQAPDECPAIETLSDARRKKIRFYLRQFPAEDFWRETFSEIWHSPFLRGRKNNNGHHSFVADLDWLLTKGKDGTENCVKTHDGKYREN